MSDVQELLCLYIEQESDELVMELLERVRFDGFAVVENSGSVSEEVVTLKLLSHALVKVVALMAERSEKSVTPTYMSAVELQVDVLKYMVLKEMRGSTT